MIGKMALAMKRMLYSRLIGNTKKAAVLVEFALVMFVFVFLALGGIELMRAYLTAQVMGEGARIAARESATQSGALGVPLDNDVFLESYTAIDLDNLIDPSGVPVTDQDGDTDVDVDDLFRVLPPLHAAMRSVMIRDDASIPGRRLLRFPGSLFRDPGAVVGHDLVVKVPKIVAEGATTDIELSKIIELDYVPATNTVMTDARYHYQFASVPSRVPATGVLRKAVDDGTIVVTNPAELGSYTVPIVYDLSPPGGLRGRFRTVNIEMNVGAVARKEVP